MISTHRKRTPTTSAVTSSTKAHSRSELVSLLCQDDMTAFGSCMPSMTNTTPLMTNTSASHTLFDASFQTRGGRRWLMRHQRDEQAGSHHGQDAACAEMLGHQERDERREHLEHHVHRDALVAVAADGAERQHRQQAHHQADRDAAKEVDGEALCSVGQENEPVIAAAMANWNDTTPDASLMSASPESRDF